MAASSRTTRNRATEPAQAARIKLGKALRAESMNYFLLLGTTLFLVAFGVIMVFSSLAADATGADFLTRGAYAAIGVVLMLIASRFPERFWMRLAWPLLVFACVLQLLVVATPLGKEVGGNQNWLVVGGFQFQPSELVKLALVLWLGVVVTKKQAVLDDFRRGVLPIILVGGAAIGLVLVGDDLGTVMVMGLSLIGALFLIGVRLRLLMLPVLAAAVLFVLFAISSENRLKRLTSFFEQHCTSYDLESCFQPQQALFSLANGGVFGVGLGNSQGKWSWLPAAESDYIFAIIGEEMGLIGAVVVLLLIVVLAYAFVRVLRQASTPFARGATAFVLVWVIGQACVNIGVVLGILPVLGVPLPLVSAGGSALITTLVAIGIVLSFARESGAWFAPAKTRKRKAAAR
ncbi:peptidoglycan glycosyltransferase FtsW [Agromyces archimandritae]|uniref:Probable peptidoglycan glycosyltransferase FtsW n=1 Tax=Agromyces archimandritae TaxID=2781962 RepID=A0A975FPQ1_9MICO|nr:putative peptidoglycan glycosyltransferase FtsW [Agromyces archimandritae]QTX04906.1 cell division protein FtsW [Agromyces archimandritae]